MPKLLKPLPRREVDVEKYLKKRVEEKGALCVKFTSPGFTGMPDRLVIAAGRVAFVEVKREGGKISPRQGVVLQQLMDLHQSVWVVYNKDEVDQFIKEFFNV